MIAGDERGRRRTTRDERGVATVPGIALLAVLLAVTYVAAVAVGMIAWHRRAQGAADLAALAGAQALQRGGDPCAEAGRVAEGNGAQLHWCRPDGFEVSVEVTTSMPASFAGELRARARAGPEP